MDAIGRYAFRHLAGFDIALLKDLNRVFGEAFGAREVYQTHLPGDEYLVSLLGKHHFIAIVAKAGEDVIGGLVAYELDKLEQDRREIYIYDLAVAEAHRRNGVATRLIGELTRIAALRKAYVVYVQADPEDGPAIALYEYLGTKEAVFHFDIAVGGAAD